LQAVNESEQAQIIANNLAHTKKLFLAGVGDR